MLKTLGEAKTLDFTRMKVVPTKDKVMLIDKDFQKSFLKTYKKQIHKEFEN